MTSSVPPPWVSDLAASLSGLQTEAVIDLRIEVEGCAPYVLRCADGVIQVTPECDPERTVVLRISAAGADQVRNGATNAQRLLAAGELTIGGRIDVLQAAAAHLSALEPPS